MTQSVSVYFVLFLALALIQVCVHPPPSAVNVALPAFAAERSAANPPHAAAVVDLSSMGQTDRRTGGRSTVT